MVVYAASLGLVLAALVRQRLQEVRLSHRNEAGLRSRGAVEVGPSFRWPLTALHAFWFLSLATEAGRRGSWPGIGVSAFGLLLALTGQGLRRSAIATLKERWVMSNQVVPGEELVRAGPYRWLRHPNYLGVFFELVGFPLIWGAAATALSGGLAYLALTYRRLQFEEKAHHVEHAGSRRSDS